MWRSQGPAELPNEQVLYLRKKLIQSENSSVFNQSLSHLKRCGLNFPLVEVLPRSASWALHLQEDEDEQEDELELGEGNEKMSQQQTPVYKFSGNSAAKLPHSFLPSGTLRGDATFTIIFWFRSFALIPPNWPALK